MVANIILYQLKMLGRFHTLNSPLLINELVIVHDIVCMQREEKEKLKSEVNLTMSYEIM